MFCPKQETDLDITVNIITNALEHPIYFYVSYIRIKM